MEVSVPEEPVLLEERKKMRSEFMENFPATLTCTRRPCLVLKNFQDFLSHQIFGHIHRTLNVVKENNQLHSLAVNDEMNLLSLINS